MVHLTESSKVVLLGNAIHTYISLLDEAGQMSKELNMNQTGNDSIKLEKQDQQLYEFGVNVSLVCVDQS